MEPLHHPPSPGIVPLGAPLLGVSMERTGQRWGGFPVWKVEASGNANGATTNFVMLSLGGTPARLIDVSGWYSSSTTHRPAHVFPIVSMNYPGNGAPVIVLTTGGDLTFVPDGAVIFDWAVEARFAWYAR